jgi:MazG family protein
MADLRNPQSGCPWDIRQTSQSIAPHTLDETHELIDAIERDDSENIKEELGDLLFNIVFHARIAEENGAFDFDDVAQGITDKMLRRHPHVFGDARDRQWSDAELAQQWQAMKAEEKQQQGENPAGTETLDDSSVNSAIYRARQIQQHAALFGFDWPDIGPVFDKLEEELAELKQAFATGDKDAISDELGDLMFVCVNLARHARVNAEMSLRQTNRKFQRRFAYVQQQMTAAGIEMDQRQLEQMERFWQESKNQVDQQVTHDPQQT